MLIKNRLVTTRQKKYIEKTLSCLGISIDELMLINNLKFLLDKVEQLEKVNTTQNEQIEVLTKALEVSTENVQRLAVTVQELILKMERNAFSQIFEGFDDEVNDYYKGGGKEN